MTWDEIMTKIEEYNEQGYYFTIRSCVVKLVGNLTVSFVADTTKQAAELTLKRIDEEIRRKSN